MNFTPFAYFNPTLSTTASVSFIGTTYSAAASVTYTFTNVNLGGSGLCVVCVHGEISGLSGRSVNSVSVGGVAATLATQVSSGLNATGTNAAIFYIRQTSTTGNVVIVFNSPGVSRCLISVYRIQDNNSDTPYLTNSSHVSNGTGRTYTFTDAEINSVGICIETMGLDTVTGVAWTNATLNYNVGSAPLGATRTTGASFTTTSGGTRTVSVSHTNSTQPLAAAGALWK